VKNMNSMRNVQRAIEHEIERQINVLKAGGKLFQETRNFDAVTGTTSVMRTKEAANDYRYFPEPDLAPVIVNDKQIEAVKVSMPALPRALFKKYTSEYKLSEYDAGVLTENRDFALYFEHLTTFTNQYKAAANWMIGPVKSYLNEKAIEISGFHLEAKSIAVLIELVESGKVSFTSASQKIFPEMILYPQSNPMDIAEKMNLLQESDASALESIVKEAISKYPEKVTEYKSGKTGLIGLFMGEVMKLSKGKADPKIANKLVKDLLDSSS